MAQVFASASPAMFGEFEKIFDKYADVDIIARATLGADARRASAAQLRAFSDAFGSYLARKYGRRFREFIGSGKELLVVLAKPPAESEIRLLSELGLQPSRDQRVWTRSLDERLEDLAGFTGELEGRGLEVAEMRLREPGLRSVFFRLAGREIDA